MKLKPIILGFITVLSLSLLTFGPEMVSAKRSPDGEKSAKTRTLIELRDSTETREEFKRRAREATKQARNEKPNAFTRAARFFKKLIAPADSISERERERAGEVDEEENDDDLPPFMRGRIDRQEYLLARQD